MDTNRQIVLAETPVGPLLDDGCFQRRDGEVPEVGPGQVLVRTILLSVDPANRMYLRTETYRPRVMPGEVVAAWGLAEVIDPGDSALSGIVFCECGWQEFAAVDAGTCYPVTVRTELSHHASALGLTGMTAYFGMMDVIRPEPAKTLLVSAAAGATGNVAGQIGRIHGMRVVGVSGSEEKNAFLERELGLAAGVNHRADDVAGQLARSCPDGIDGFFDNVGGRIVELALPLMNPHGRIASCGAMSAYESDDTHTTISYDPTLVPMRRLTISGFLVLDHFDRWPAAEEVMAEWVRSGELTVVQRIHDGLDAAPAALIELLQGGNLGKQLVRVAADPG